MSPMCRSRDLLQRGRHHPTATRGPAIVSSLVLLDSPPAHESPLVLKLNGRGFDDSAFALPIGLDGWGPLFRGERNFDRPHRWSIWVTLASRESPGVEASKRCLASPSFTTVVQHIHVGGWPDRMVSNLDTRHFAFVSDRDSVDQICSHIWLDGHSNCFGRSPGSYIRPGCRSPRGKRSAEGRERADCCSERSELSARNSRSRGSPQQDKHKNDRYTEQQRNNHRTWAEFSPEPFHTERLAGVGSTCRTLPVNQYGIEGDS